MARLHSTPLLQKRHKIVLVMVITLLIITGLKLNEEKMMDCPIEIDITSYKSPIKIETGLKDWLDIWYCDVQCMPHSPCDYKDEVALRILVLTYKRPNSLKKTLDSILNMHTLNDKVSVEIWIDRSTDGKIDEKTIAIAKQFKHQWSEILYKGRACIHLQPQNAFINLQWTNSWRPKENTKEIALILEDDVSISAHAYRWLKATHRYFENHTKIAGYTLQMEDINYFAPLKSIYNMVSMKADEKQKIFLYPVLGTWGYSPHPIAWRKYQNWFRSARPHHNIASDLFMPHVPGIIPTKWYNDLLRSHTHESMWSIWHIKFTHDYQMFTVYCNLKEYTGKENVLLSTNRKEPGLHFHPEAHIDNDINLLIEWKDDYVRYPRIDGITSNLTIKYNYDGSICNQNCCFSTTCYGIIDMFWQKSWLDVIKLVFSSFYI